MNHEADRLALLMFAEIPGVGERTLRRLYESARALKIPIYELARYPAHELSQVHGLPPAAARFLEENRLAHEQRCRALYERLLASGARLAGVHHDDYPKRWRQHCANPPPLACWTGCGSVLASQTLAILNSRSVTERMVTTTVLVAQHAAREGFTVVSGGMKATHRIAAVAVRAAGAARAVVLDRGLLAALGPHPELDPFGFGPARSPLDTRRTLVLSPFRPYDHAAPHNGRRRDDLVAALADVIVAVSARPGGEIERICLAALDRGQCVLSWQGENEALAAAGARSIDRHDLEVGIARLLPHSPGEPRTF